MSAAALKNFVSRSLIPCVSGGLVLDTSHGHAPNLARLYLWLALLAVPLAFHLVCKDLRCIGARERNCNDFCFDCASISC